MEGRGEASLSKDGVVRNSNVIQFSRPSIKIILIQKIGFENQSEQEVGPMNLDALYG